MLDGRKRRTMLQPIYSILTPIHREGYRFIAVFLVGTIVLFLTGFEALGSLGADL
jgi:hypothetical protein